MNRNEINSIKRDSLQTITDSLKEPNYKYLAKIIKVDYASLMY